MVIFVLKTCKFGSALMPFNMPSIAMVDDDNDLLISKIASLGRVDSMCENSLMQ